MKDINSLLKQTLSPQRAMEHVRHIALHHRVQASPGYRDAAEYCQKALQAAGLDSRILSYPADGEQRYLDDLSFREWHCRDARLTLCTPHNETLCDFSADNLCIAQRSAPADFRAEGLDIICLPQGATKESCADMDLAGKLVLIDAFLRDGLRWIFEEKRAAGVITDRVQYDEGLRSRTELYDCRTYHSFPFDGINESQTHGFAFVLTPRQGDRLRALCADMKKQHEQDPQKPAFPKAKGFIDSGFSAGAIENVLCTIPGETDECILLTAHLCHPKPCANDNASGCAAAMELMRSLHELISQGLLPRPHRTIRMLLVPEMTGTNAYLHTLGEGRRKLIAGVNLDMVGARQGSTAGPVIIFRTPEACASLISDLACLVSEQAGGDFPAVFSATETVGMHQFAVRRFCGGSDHQIFCDPLIGIPFVSFTQWPDLYYHTSGDTVERIDPQLVAKSARIAGGIVWTLANMDESCVDSLLSRATENYLAALRREVSTWQSKQESPQQLERRLALTEEAAVRALSGLERLLCGGISDTLRSLLTDERAKLSALREQALRRTLALAGMRRELPASTAQPTTQARLIRTFLGDPYKARIDELFQQAGSQTLLEQHKKYGALESYIDYWTCGQFTCDEIAERAIWEYGSGDREFVGQYLRLLNRAGLVKPADNTK